MEGGGRGMPGQCVTRYASRHSTNQNALFVDWFSRLERAFFGGEYGESLALFQACVGNFDTIPPWKVVGTYYLDSSYVTFKYFAFLSVWDKLELLGHVHEPPWWFECYFRRSSWIHCWLLLAVLTDFIIIFGLPFLFVNFGVYPGLHLLVFPLWSVENVLEWRDRLSQVAELLKRVTPNPRRVCSILNQ